MDPLVTVVREQKVVAWPDDGRPVRAMDKAYVMPLSRALTRLFSTDAHLAQYITPNGRRLRTAAAEADITVRMDVLVLDMDCKQVHGTKDEPPPEWRADNRNKILALRAAHQGLVFYETRGGARVVYRQPVPYFVDSLEAAADWKRDYAITCAYLKRVFDIEADPACADWTRLFRLPRATRDGKDAPEPWPLAGDPNNVHALWFEPHDEDRAAAMELLPRAFEPKQVRKAVTPTGYCDGYGVFFHALSARGDVFRQHRTGAHVIRCPNESAHTGGKTGDTSTILYLPGPGDVLGFVWCLHAHCQHLGAKDWMRCFSDNEIDAAREAAGLPTRSCKRDK